MAEPVRALGLTPQIFPERHTAIGRLRLHGGPGWNHRRLGRPRSARDRQVESCSSRASLFQRARPAGSRCGSACQPEVDGKNWRSADGRVLGPRTGISGI